MPKNTRLAYSTETDSACPKCGWPVKDCRCAANLDEPVPDRITAKLRIEKSGRKGKTVTVVGGLPKNTGFVADLAKELKKACGSGGTAQETSVEIQGDHRDKVREVLRAKGWTVKG